MKKIYLLFLALIATLSMSIHAQDYYIFGDFDGSGTWQYYPLNKENDTHYYNQITSNTNQIKFLIRDNNGDYYKWYSTDDRNANGNIENGGYSIPLAKNEGGDIILGDNKTVTIKNNQVYYFDYYPADNWIKITENNTNSKSPANPVLPENFRTQGDFYFYGDLNRWSSLDSDVAGKEITVKNGKGDDVTDDIYPNGAPTHFTVDQLQKNWKFQKAEGALASGSYSWDWGWYVLDMSKAVDTEGHKGRLEGQFQIIKGKREEDSWGFNYDKTKPNDYFAKAIKVGTPAYLDKVSGTTQNLHLDNNYIEGAKIYFNPTTNQIYVTGSGKDSYVYYTANRDDVCQPYFWEILDVSQDNYYTNASEFNTKSAWEKLGSQEYQGVTYSTVWRRRIPAGATYRYPISINVLVKNDAGNLTFPQAQIMGEDIWFVENNVNLYYRYDDDAATNSLTWVVYNAFNKNFDSAGVPESYDYAFGGRGLSLKDAQPLIKDGKWGVAIKRPLNDEEKAKVPEEYKVHADGSWWVSPVVLPYEFTSNTWAMFGDSRGAVFPAEREKAIDEDLNSVQIRGNDVFYVVPTTNQNPEIVYSHLNGSYSLKDHHTIQINAEFFNPDGETPYELLNDLSANVTYNFDIYKDGVWVGGTGTQEATNAYKEEPFLEWNPTTTGGTGFYFIVVKAKYNDEIYTSTDVYQVFE